MGISGLGSLVMFGIVREEREVFFVSDCWINEIEFVSKVK